MSRPPLYAAWAGAGDLVAMLALERASYSHPWSEASLISAVEDPEVDVLVLREPGRDLAAHCIFQVVAGELHVHNLAVSPAFRRQGLARFVVELVQGLAIRRRALVAYLEVREGNAAARGLYQALGYEPIGRRRGYYDTPVEDALVLRRGLAAGASGMGRPDP